MKRLLALAAAMCLWVGAGLCERPPTLDAPEDAPLLRTARIRAAGDIMVHEKQLDIARKSDGSYDFHPQFALVRKVLANADYTIANLETTIGRCGGKDYSGFPAFNSPESLLSALKDAGVDFLSLANNHILDRYEEGLSLTVRLVDEYGFEHGGANRTRLEKEKPVIVDVNGIKIGMLCCTQTTNGMERFCSSDVKAFEVNYLNAETVAGMVRALRDAGAEVVIALPHWGKEYRRHPEGDTEKLAKKLVAAGVDVILGSHPHMVQPVEFVTAKDADGSTRRGLVAYSLGNCISDMSTEYTDAGIILEFTLRENQAGGFEVTDVGAVPIYCWRTDKTVQTVPVLKYYKHAPDDMDYDGRVHMRASVEQIKEVLGKRFALIEE